MALRRVTLAPPVSCRRDGVARFLEAASAHFTVEELREDSFHPDYYHHDLQVLVLTPR